MFYGRQPNIHVSNVQILNRWRRLCRYSTRAYLSIKLVILVFIISSATAMDKIHVEILLEKEK